MNPTLYLNCLVVFISSLAWTARAAPSQGDQTFNSELTRLKNIYGNNSVDQFTTYRNVAELMNFYEKYGNQLQLTLEERQQGDNALRQYKEEKAKQDLVEGAPSQGFWWFSGSYTYTLKVMDTLKILVRTAVECYLYKQNKNLSHYNVTNCLQK